MYHKVSFRLSQTLYIRLYLPGINEPVRLGSKLDRFRLELIPLLHKRHQADRFPFLENQRHKNIRMIWKKFENAGR